MDKENILQAAENNEVSPDQNAEVKDVKFNEQLKVNEQLDLERAVQELSAGKSPEKKLLLEKAKRAIGALTAGAMMLLASMGPGEAWAGGNQPGAIGGEGLSAGKVKAEQMAQQDQEERENPNITVNGKAGKVIFEKGGRTVYGDEHTRYQEDSRGNQSVIGGVVIDK